jgi:hypothetical protein
VKRVAKANGYQVKGGETMAYTVIWYGREGIIEKASFDAEKAAKDHAVEMFPARQQRDAVVAVEVRKDSGAVVFSRAAGR